MTITITLIPIVPAVFCSVPIRWPDWLPAIFCMLHKSSAVVADYAQTNRAAATEYLATGLLWPCIVQKVFWELPIASAQGCTSYLQRAVTCMEMSIVFGNGWNQKRTSHQIPEKNRQTGTIDELTSKRMSPMDGRQALLHGWACAIQ